jgi:cold shock CspA family protein
MSCRIRDLDVRLSLRYGGEEIKIEGGGRVGHLEAGQSSLLEIAFPSDREIWPIRVDGQKNVVMARDESEAENVVLCRTAINIKKSSQSGVAHTQYPDNHVRLLRRIGPGVIELWEIALVSQDGVFWVTAQKTYSIAVGLDENEEFYCPQFEERWPQLVSFLAELLEGEELPVLATVAADITTDTSGLGANEGFVLWWNAAQQMGAINTAKGAARVHWSQIVAQNGARRFLVSGQRVVFDHLRRPKTEAGGRPTGFKKEAVGVKPIAS